MFHVKQNIYDVVIVGGGHAGVEAALVTKRLGMKVLLITLSEDSIARMSCNPSIGGLAKGHLVTEIDVLGGEMGKAIDRTGIQFKILNKSKGRAVWSLRAQADKLEYENYMQEKLKSENVEILEDMVIGVITNKGKIRAVETKEKGKIKTHSAILSCGTFLNGTITIGENQYEGGRLNEKNAKGLTASLTKLGFKSGRLKTGTPARLKKDTINLTKLEEQYGDQDPIPFSYFTGNFDPPDFPCYITHTNSKTHQIIRDNLDRAPLFTGIIEGVGPRYCPSIEDKVVRFSDRNSHHVFLEPEWKDSNQIYANGISTSLPLDVQKDYIRTIEGLEKAEWYYPGYAIEYDFFPSYQIFRTLETKNIENLYFAGQINGTSGYEEAAALGLMAGLNTFYKINNDDPFILDRSEAYIGVLIDDLITNDPREPYRMFTSRAEHRLVLRFDNSDRRLYKKSRRVNIVPDYFYQRTEDKINFIKEFITYTKDNYISPDSINPILEKKGSSTVSNGISINRLLKRPEIELNDIIRLLPENYQETFLNNKDYKNQVEIDIKYEGYIKRNQKLIEQMKKYENIKIPEDIEYKDIKTLKNESIEKLNKIKPETLAQASRISGVSPADVTSIMIYLKN